MSLTNWNGRAPPSIAPRARPVRPTRADEVGMVLAGRWHRLALRPEILAEALDWPADLIVVGAHRRSMATYLLGSTASALSRHAHCTVMIVRSPLKAKLI